MAVAVAVAVMRDPQLVHPRGLKVLPHLGGEVGDDHDQAALVGVAEQLLNLLDRGRVHLS